MFGNNIKLAPDKGDGSTLQVKSIFSTIQGEGPYVGTPSVFIRLSGCNLACSFCDTDFNDYQLLSTSDILESVKGSWSSRFSSKKSQLRSLYSLEKIKSLSTQQKITNLPKLVVITGGEPLRQNIEPLCNLLISQGITVQIESNGSIHRSLPRTTQIVCSPKPQNGRYYHLHDVILQRTIALKFLISRYHSGYEDIAEIGQTNYNIPVYVQPMDLYDSEKNKDNIDLALYIASIREVKLSLQIHKILQID